ncbi:putative ribonuclease H-like domain-containing protein, partial [Tanacetum coccineum]
MVKNQSRIEINKWYQSFTLRNFDLEDMELESTNSGPTAKLPILKLGEYKMWGGLTFSQYPDAKSMFAAIETRFGGNAATKKTQKTLLKQQYENFSATSALSKFMKIDFGRGMGGGGGGNRSEVATLFAKCESKEALLPGSAEHQEQGRFCSEIMTKQEARKQRRHFQGNTQRGLDTVEAQLVTYRKNEVLFSEEVVVLKREVGIKQYEINMLKTVFEKVKQEKDGIEFKIEKFDKASKDLDQLLESQITDKSKKGLGYSAVPPPHPLIYNRPNKLDLSYSGLDEFKEPEFKGYGLENKQESQVKSSFVEGCGSNTSKNVSEVEPKKVRKNNDAPIIEDWVSDDEEQDESMTKPERNWHSLTDDKGFVGQWMLKAHDDTECLVLSPNFKLPDENQILLKVPRKDNMYSFDMKNIVPKESLTCLVAKATLDESMLWHRRLGHINFKNINKLVKDNLVRGLPTKCFENDQTCVACLKGKQHKNFFNLMHKKYCLVVTDDYSRFTWVFFLTTKDETSEILKRFIKEIENLVDKKVKIIRSDNGTEFKNKVMDDFCREKGIKREYSVARTPQQNGVAERRNRTLIEAARTMLADSKLPTTFWAEAVSTACYVQNRVLVVKPHNKTPYELFRGTSEENSQECIVMLIWKDTSYFDSPTENVDNGKPKTADDAQKQDEDVNTASPDVNTGSLKLNVFGPSVSTTSPNEEDSTEEEPEVDLGNITNSYIVPTTPSTRIHKDHPINNVIGEVQSTVQTRRMLKPTSEQGFLSGSNAGRTSAIQTLTDPDHPDKVYKVVKALYGLHQAPRAWYETLANYLLENRFKGKIDQTLFIKKQKKRYFACTGMSSIGELTFFLGLQVQQKEEGIFISQDKYVAEILKKFNYSDVKSASTPVDLEKPLFKDGDADDVNVHLYRSVIGSLMYLTASRPDIIDYAGATQDRKSTTGGCQFLGNRLISWQCKKKTMVATSTTEAEYVAAASCYLLTKGFDAGRQKITTARQKINAAEITWAPKLQLLPNSYLLKHCLRGGYLLIQPKSMDERMCYIISSGPRCQDTIVGDVDAQTRFEIPSKQSNDPPLSRGYTLRSREDSMKLLELIELFNAVKHMLMLPVQVPAAEGDFINT